jgi:hypothetical protein
MPQIVATMVHLLQARRVTHLGRLKYRRLVVHPSRASRHCRRKAAKHSPSPAVNGLSTPCNGVDDGMGMRYWGQTVGQSDAFPLKPT